MPIISMFFGIRIYMYVERGARHHARHIHAYYGDYDLAVDFQGNILEGDMPKKQKAMVIAWVLMHEEELNANYELLLAGEQPFRIEPLR